MADTMEVDLVETQLFEVTLKVIRRNIKTSFRDFKSQSGKNGASVVVSAASVAQWKSALFQKLRRHFKREVYILITIRLS
jgi:RNase P protein component